MRALLAAVLLLAGCAGTSTREDGLSDLFQAEPSRAARRRAPDLFAAAERARDEATRARQAGDIAAADDHATRARLLLAAAVAESERITMEERRLELEHRVEEVAGQASRDEEAAATVQREVTRELAARLARRQADEVFRAAAEDELRRYRRQGEGRDAMYREGFALVVGRTRLVLAAAVAAGADPDAAERIRTRLEALRIGRRPDAAMESADGLLREALALLGSARARAGAQPSTDEVAALVAEATEAGFAVERLDRGLVVTVPVRGNAPRPGPGAVAALARLIAGHPHGPVRIEVSAPRSPQAQADAVLRSLTEAGAGGERVGATGIEGAARVDAVFVSYVPR